MNPPPAFRRRGFVTTAAVGGAAIILTLQLLVPPIIGLADNGDFIRVMGLVGLGYVPDRYEDRYFGWMQPRFTVVEPRHNITGYHTSENLFVGAAVLASRALFPGRLFDVRLLGVLHVLFLNILIGAIVAAGRDLAAVPQWLIAALLVFFFTDVGYAASFNSLYAQTASFLFLLMAVALAAIALRRGGLAGTWLLAYFLAAALFVGSKPQEAIQAPLLALFAWRLAGLGGRRRRATVALAILLCAFAVWYGRRVGNTTRPINLYNVVFLNLLPYSTDPAGDLTALGLDPAWARYSGMHAEEPASAFHDPGFRARLTGGTSHGALVRFYLTHPRALRGNLARAARSCFRLRPRELGNFAKEAGGPPGQMATCFSCWSALRLKLSGWGALVVLLGGNFLAAGLTWPRASRRGRLFREGLLTLTLMATLSFLVCALTDTPGDLVRHLYAFHALCDLILIADVAWATQSVATRIRSHKPAAEAG